ncbi:MAG: DUF971 domain-containing protein [Acidobacteria bacterium]|nr:DUF971 domain-containing protein [Acidobacteriota bacterium]
MTLADGKKLEKILVPLEVGRAGEHDIRIRWNDSSESIYIARKLRMECPCAHCVDETTGRRILKEPAIPMDVRPAAIEPVGRYGICIHWSDGHSTGIYTWEKLYGLAQR